MKNGRTCLQYKKRGNQKKARKFSYERKNKC